MIDYQDCISEGFLKKIAPSEKQAKETMKKAIVLLKEAKLSFKAEAPNSAVMAAYSAVLDAARSLLFKDGYRERSHVCVVKYLEEKYADKLSSSEISLFDEYRDKRHKTMYSGSYYPTMEEAKRVIDFAEKFLGTILGLLDMSKEELEELEQFNQGEYKAKKPKSHPNIYTE
jgi:uncharacterized protein (UPF0332 family)